MRPNWLVCRLTLCKRYEMVKFTVPENYVHTTQLASFVKENHREFYVCSDDITDKNFVEVTNKLTHGETYEAKIFGITKIITSKDCLAFLKAQKAILVGAQGISVVWQQAKEQFPKKKRIISFDEEDALWQGADGLLRMPDMSLDQYPSGGWRFDLGYFWSDRDSDDCILCVCNLNT